MENVSPEDSDNEENVTDSEHGDPSDSDLSEDEMEFLCNSYFN